MEYTYEDEEVMKMVGKRIRQLRRDRNISQNRLGLEADLTKNQIGRVERAERNTSLVTLNRIARALGIKLYDLFLFD